MRRSRTDCHEGLWEPQLFLAFLVLNLIKKLLQNFKKNNIEDLREPQFFLAHNY